MPTKEMRPRDVVFRRVRGRIVPIKINKIQDKTRGVGLIAAGAAVSGASGSISKKLSKKFIAKTFEVDTLTQFARESVKGSKRQKGFLIGAAKKLKAAKGINIARAGVLGGGILLGGALVSAGLNRLLPNAKKSEIGEQTLNAGSQVATFTIASSFYDLKGLSKILGSVAKIVKR